MAVRWELHFGDSRVVPQQALGQLHVKFRNGQVTTIQQEPFAEL